MSETKTLLHADPKSERYSYLIEQTAEHTTVVVIERDAKSHWKYHVTAERTSATAPPGVPHKVEADAEGFATADAAIAAARNQARVLLAGDEDA